VVANIYAIARAAKVRSELGSHAPPVTYRGIDVGVCGGGGGVIIFIPY
jgi:hypothetical protein